MDIELQEISQWRKLRPTLNNSYQFDHNPVEWSETIKLFTNRLRRKFFNPVRSLISKNTLNGEGFTIVMVQCAIIESLASFREGKIYSHGPLTGKPKYMYNNSRDMFTFFLHSAKIFEGNFYQIDPKLGRKKNVPFDATEFYKNVRCGLVHEARTKGPWHINATKKDAKTETTFIERDGHKIKILRTVLHYRLIDYLKEYVQELKVISTNGDNLRRLFARKLDHLFDIPTADRTGYDWWDDR